MSLTAIGLIMTIGTIDAAIADQRLVNTLARLTTELIGSTRGTIDLIRLIGTIRLTITTPRGGNAILIRITVGTTARNGGGTGKVIWSTGRKSATILLILQQH